MLGKGRKLEGNGRERKGRGREVECKDEVV